MAKKSKPERLLLRWSDHVPDVDEVDFLNDDALLDRMQQAASKFNHTISTPWRFRSIARR
jgi:hypothetical protein